MGRIILLLSLMSSCFAFDQTALNFGVDVYHFCLKNQKTSYSEKNYLIGGTFEAHYMTPHTTYLGIRTLIAEGSLNGKTTYGFDTEHDALEKKAEGRVGYNFYHFPLRCTPFLGFGYYSFDDSWKFAGVVSRYRTWYIPIGVSFGIWTYPHLILGCNGQLNVIVTGNWRMEGHPVFSKCEERLRTTLFYELEFPLQYHCRFFDLSCVPHFRWGDFKRINDQGVKIHSFSQMVYGVRMEFGYAY